MAAKNTLFADCATMLLRRALNEGFALTIVVTREGARADGVDLDGCAIKLTSRSSQLALPLAPVEAVPPCECPALVEAPAPAVDPLAPGHRVMRTGDAVFEARSDGSVILHACALCGHTHAIPWSAWCALCWGYALGRVPDEVGDEEVAGRG